ncbi:hypothetical protein [Acaryochloris thomasi]|nr:hypothetical protein [Acaryochloris thomasi]
MKLMLGGHLGPDVGCDRNILCDNSPLLPEELLLDSPRASNRSRMIVLNHWSTDGKPTVTISCFPAEA